MAVIRGIAAAVQIRVAATSVDFSLRTFNVYVRSIARGVAGSVFGPLWRP